MSRAADGDVTEWLFHESIDADLSACFPSRVATIRADVDVSPRLPLEIFARSADDAIAERARKAGHDILEWARGTRKSGSNLQGNLASISLPDVLVMLEVSRRTGVLSICTQSTLAQLHFDRGDLVHVACGELDGHEAFYALMNEEIGDFEFCAEEVCRIDSGDRTIRDSLTGLIMEGARLLDEARAPGRVSEAPPPKQASRAPPRIPSVATLVPSGGESPETLDLELVARADSLLSSSSALGIARRFARGEPTNAEVVRRGGRRVRMVFAADLVEGLSHILALSDAHSIDEVATRGRFSDAAFGLSFNLDTHLSVDVVLADLFNPFAVMGALDERPTVFVLAPPRGSFAGLGARARVEIEVLVDVLKPLAVLGLGDASIDELWTRVRDVRDEPVVARCLRGALEDERQLRGLVAEGLRMAAEVSGSIGRRARPAFAARPRERRLP